MLLCKQIAWTSASLPALGLVGKVVSLLCQANARGNVVMRFERCAYLQFEEQLICIGLNEIGASSISGLFECNLRALPKCLVTGASVQLSNEYLVVDDQHFFDLLGAMLYDPAPCNNLSGVERIPIRYQFLSKLTLPSAGIAPLLRQVVVAKNVADSTCTSTAIRSESALLRLAKPAITQLAIQLRVNTACSFTRTSPIEFNPELFQILIGAGPGLTPSGDDFICGVFTALHLSDFSDIALSLWASIRNVAKFSTTPVSAAMLEQSALGESGERLEAVVQAYCHYPVTATNDFQLMVDRIGETSGWDWLTGFVLCVDILWHERIKIPESFEQKSETVLAAQIF